MKSLSLSCQTTFLVSLAFKNINRRQNNISQPCSTAKELLLPLLIGSITNFSRQFLIRKQMNLSIKNGQSTKGFVVLSLNINRSFYLMIPTQTTDFCKNWMILMSYFQRSKCFLVQFLQMKITYSRILFHKFQEEYYT